MKKYTTIVKTKSGEEQKISVYLDDATAHALDTANDERITHLYVVEEYLANLVTRKETRRHNSLEEMLEVGEELVDHESNPAEAFERKEEYAELYKALDTLTDKQYKVFVYRELHGYSLTKIAEMLDISIPTAHEIYGAAKKKLKKFFKVP